MRQIASTLEMCRDFPSDQTKTYTEYRLCYVPFKTVSTDTIFNSPFRFVNNLGSVRADINFFLIATDGK